MRVINKKILLIILLVGIILISVIILNPNKEIKLNNVILKQDVNNKTFAMYKETINGYEEYMENKFPKDYVLNIDKSKCVDKDGVEIENALYTKNNQVGVRSNKSFYCYLYFDKSLGLEIKEKEPSGLSVDKERGAMYRFQGQAKDAKGNELVNNFICFGTSDKDKCVKDNDHYMYRIIGIEAETGRVKVIKKEALNETYPWYTDDDHNIVFPESIIYETISGTGFLKNSDYIPKGWEEKIANNTWLYGDMRSNDILGAKQTGEGLYEIETGKKETKWYNWADEHTEDAIQTTVESNKSKYYGDTIYYTNGSGKWTQSFEGKVSLMYLYDYSYSVGDEAKCNVHFGEEEYSKCKLGWMHLSQNDVDAPSEHEWTMSRVGWDDWSGYFLGHYVNSQGFTKDYPMPAYISVRPVFYINASEKLLDGLGTIDNPFIIS